MLELDFFPRKCKGGKIRFKALKRGFQKGGKIPKPAEKIHFSGEIIPEAPFSADFACLKSRPFYPSVGKFGAPTGRLFPSWPVARRLVRRANRRARTESEKRSRGGRSVAPVFLVDAAPGVGKGCAAADGAVMGRCVACMDGVFPPFEGFGISGIF
jgi:hypothetical protein